MMKIGNREYKDGYPFIIAEVGMAHDGSLTLAHQFIEEVSATGADAIKFQMHYADHESSREEQFRVPTAFPQDKSRYDYWKRTEFTPREWRELFDHALNCKLHPLISPFSNYAVDICKNIGCYFWKVASGEVPYFPYDQILDDQLIIISTGLHYDTVTQLYNQYKFTKQLALLYCVSKYPAPLVDIHLNQLDAILHNVVGGISDHSANIAVPVTAYNRNLSLLGEDPFIIEVHVKLHDAGVDAPASLYIGEFETMCQILADSHELHLNRKPSPLTDADLEYRQHMRQTFGKSVATRYPIPAGSTLSEQDLTMLKPGHGFQSLSDIGGRTLKKGKSAREILKPEDFQ